MKRFSEQTSLGVFCLRLISVSAASVCLMIACSAKGRDLELLIPEGFRGMFKIVPNKNGVPAKRKETGELSFLVATNGICATSTADAFKHWHSLSVITYRGKRVQVGTSQDTKAAVQLRPLGSDDTGTYYFFIGTENECRDAAASRFHELSLGTVR